MISVSSLLSCSARKRELFAVDPYFRDAWDDILDRWDREETTGKLLSLASVIWRPDAIVVRGVRRGLNAIRELGFVPVAAAIFRYNRQTVREGWRYQLNIATRERIDVMDMIMPATDSLYVMLKRTSADAMLPASTYLSSHKGPSLPEHREPHHLRALIGDAQVSVLTYLHISDEPADLVRELGVFFDRPRRLEILNGVDANEDISAKLDSMIDELYAQIPEHQLNFNAALDRVKRAAREKQRTLDHPSLTALLELCDHLRHGDSRDWKRLLSLVDRSSLSIDYWDRVAIAAPLAEKHLNEKDLIPDISLADWSLVR
jgi:hypothetical protein